MQTSTETSRGLTGTEWLICAIAAIGFAFDTYELLMLPLIVGPALGELIHARPGTPAYADWVGLLFFVPAVFGGIFGLLGGYLTDRLGRRRVLTWSILVYALSALAAGYATNIYWLLVFRCTTFVGVCVEFVAATAWLAELFSDPRAARARARLHAGVRIGGRAAGELCLLPVRDARRTACRRSTAATPPGATR